MTNEDIVQTIARLNGRSQVDAFEAAKAIWNDPDLNLETSLLSTLRNGRRPLNRAAAAYAMQIVTTPRTVRALEQAVANKAENPRVRGYAAEALAHAHRKKSHHVLLKLLADPSKDVRFWCAFALGQMAEPGAVSRLEHLASSDRRVVRGFHSVAEEAADALEIIRAENAGNQRNNGCAFCVVS